jgi:hypothetical protein
MCLAVDSFLATDLSKERAALRMLSDTEFIALPKSGAALMKPCCTVKKAYPQAERNESRSAFALAAR